MSRFFVPYIGESPAAVSINGHRLIILSRDKTPFDENLRIIGADSVKTFQGGNSQEEETHFLNRIARTTNAGVVVAPVDVDVSDVIKNLETQLPWLH